MHALRIIDTVGVDAGTRRLLIAAAASMLLHLGILVSVPRGNPGDDPLAEQGSSRVLIAQLVSPPRNGEATAVPPSSEDQSLPSTAESDHSLPQTPASLAPGSTGVRNPGDLYYFKASELDRRPFPLEPLEVPVPESAQHLAGVVQIRLRISETGQVDDASIVMGTGLAEFEAVALQEFARTRFHPGYRANLPVRSEMLIEVTLKPPATAGSQPSLAPAAP